MTYQVVVVGGGFGGLTAAALLAARGVNVCLLEKESSAGGCASLYAKFGYTFETGASLYAAWQPGEIHERVFEELPIAPPEVYKHAPAYVVRLPDQTEVRLTGDEEAFAASLRAAFPECAAEALAFYQEIAPIGDALRRVAIRVPDLLTASKLKRLRAIAPELSNASRIFSAAKHTAAQHLAGTSGRFRRFIDAQLQMFGLRDSQTCAYLYAAVALTIPLRGMYGICGGIGELAKALVESIKRCGGTVRFNSTVLRLAFDTSGRAIGVDLLSGERIEATRAVISNLTVWDTYERLVGSARTPRAVRRRLKSLRGWGAYLLYLGMDEATAQRLSADHILALTGWGEDEAYDAETSQLMFAAAPAHDARAPEGKRAVTVSTFTEPTQWFAYHEDESEHEAQDQAALETCWQRLHSALPELADGIEVIETATPRTFFEDTRRKLGMVGGIGQSLDVFGPQALTHRTALPNLFLVGDSTFPGLGVAAVTQSGLVVANEIAPPSKR